MSQMGNRVVVTYDIGGRRVDVIGCWDEETQPQRNDFYDLYLREPQPSFDIHLNCGDPWYPGEGGGATETNPPSREAVLEYVIINWPEEFPAPPTDPVDRIGGVPPGGQHAPA